jgi:hypothetical protein
VEPNGIPIRLTDDAEPIPGGEEAEAAGLAKEPVPVVGQAPDVVPVTPTLSKREVDVTPPALDVPVP